VFPAFRAAALGQVTCSGPSGLYNSALDNDPPLLSSSYDPSSNLLSGSLTLPGKTFQSCWLELVYNMTLSGPFL
jgi:hypothetical protein